MVSFSVDLSLVFIKKIDHFLPMIYYNLAQSEDHSNITLQ